MYAPLTRTRRRLSPLELAVAALLMLVMCTAIAVATPSSRSNGNGNGQGNGNHGQNASADAAEGADEPSSSGSGAGAPSSGGAGTSDDAKDSTPSSHGNGSHGAGNGHGSGSHGGSGDHHSGNTSSNDEGHGKHAGSPGRHRHLGWSHSCHHRTCGRGDDGTKSDPPPTCGEHQQLVHGQCASIVVDPCIHDCDGHGEGDGTDASTRNDDAADTHGRTVVGGGGVVDASSIAGGAARGSGTNVSLAGHELPFTGACLQSLMLMGTGLLLIGLGLRRAGSARIVARPSGDAGSDDRLS